MSKRLDETIGAVGFDNLINGQYPPAEVFTVKIRKEATEAKIYKRGTVLALSAVTRFSTSDTYLSSVFLRPLQSAD